MRIVTIAAGDAGRKHLALLERAVIVDLVEHLTVGMIKPAGERRYGMALRERLAGLPVIGKLAAPRVAKAAGLDLLAQHGRRNAPLWITRSRIGKPSDAVALIYEHSKTFFGIVDLSEWPPALPCARPTDVTRALPMACLTADAGLRKGRRKPVVVSVVILPHAGRMAFGAHEIPVLVQLCPMQDIIVLDLIIGIEVKPALAALVLRTTIP